MSTIFSNLTKYSEPWTLRRTLEIGIDDRALLENKVLVVKSTYGRSVCFFGKGNAYKQFIPMNDRSSAQIGTYYEITDILLQEIEKSGEIKYRCILRSENGAI